MELQHPCADEAGDNSTPFNFKGDSSTLYNFKSDSSTLFNKNANDNSPIDLSCHKRRQHEDFEPSDLTEKFQGVHINPPVTNQQFPWQQLPTANQQPAFPNFNFGLSNQLALNFIKQMYPDWLLTSLLRQQAELRNSIMTSSLRHNAMTSSCVTAGSVERQMQVQKVKQKRGELHDARRKSLVTCVDLTQGEIPLAFGELPEERASSSSVSPSLLTNDSADSYDGSNQSASSIPTNDLPTMVPGFSNKFQMSNDLIPVDGFKQDKIKKPSPVQFRPYQIPCDLCDRTYATEGALAKHMKTHEDPESTNRHKCKYCDKECTSLGALRMHIRTHTLPCKCKICGKAFSRAWLLQGHMRTHTGEKPYECSVCGRPFADRSNLRAHMQTHQTVKRYPCKGCDRTFSRISLLKRHQKSCDGYKTVTIEKISDDL